jgi:hypothetical protein
MDAEPNRKRRFRFSLRSLFIFTAVVAIGCGALGSRIERKQRERAAVIKIERSTGLVEYDYQTDERGGFSAEPFGPGWLRSIFGDNFFSEVVTVQFNLIGDEDFADLKDTLKDFPHLKEFRICAPTLSDAAVENLSGLTQLETLEFIESNLGDPALVHLKSLSRLRSLWLCGHFSRAAIGALQTALPNCKIYTVP